MVTFCSVLEKGMGCVCGGGGGERGGAIGLIPSYFQLMIFNHILVKLASR